MKLINLAFSLIILSSIFLTSCAPECICEVPSCPTQSEPEYTLHVPKEPMPVARIKNHSYIHANKPFATSQYGMILETSELPTELSFLFEIDFNLVDDTHIPYLIEDSSYPNARQIGLFNDMSTLPLSLTITKERYLIIDNIYYEGYRYYYEAKLENDIGYELWDYVYQNGTPYEELIGG